MKGWNFETLHIVIRPVDFQKPSCPLPASFLPWMSRLNQHVSFGKRNFSCQIFGLFPYNNNFIGRKVQIHAKTILYAQIHFLPKLLVGFLLNRCHVMLSSCRQLIENQTFMLVPSNGILRGRITHKLKFRMIRIDFQFRISSKLPTGSLSSKPD